MLHLVAAQPQQEGFAFILMPPNGVFGYQQVDGSMKARLWCAFTLHDLASVL